MGLRREAEFQNDLGKYFKLNLYDSLTSGPSTPFILSARGFDLEYQTKDRTRFTGVIPSSVSFDIVHTSSADDTLVNDIKTAPYKRFQLEILISDNGTTFSEYWCGNVLSDVSAEQNLSFFAGTQTTITVTDGLAQLVDVKVDDNNTYTLNQLTPFVDYIRKCLLNDVGTSFCWGASDRFLQTMVNWWTNTMPTPAQSVDPLRQCGSIFRAFKTVENNQAVSISSFDMLDRICQAFGARLFLSKGQWRFHQVNSFAQMSSGQFRRSYYKGSNTIIASNPDDNIITSGGNVLNGGTFDTLPPVQKVKVAYDFLHNLTLLNDPIVLWNTWTDAGGATGTLSNTVYDSSSNLLSQSIGNITQETDASLAWNLLFMPRYFGTDTQWNASDPYPGAAGAGLATYILARFKLVGDGGTTYYLNITQNSSGAYEWTTDATLVGLKNIFSASHYTDYWSLASGSPLNTNLLGLNGISVDGTYDAVPDSGELFFEGYGRFSWFNPFGPSAGSTDVDNSMTIYPNQSASPVQKGLALGCPTPDGQDQHLSYLVNNASTTKNIFTVTQGSSVSNTILEADEQFLGTGPTAMSNTRIICYSNTSLTSFDTGTNETWEVYEQTTGDGVTGRITKILGKEILSGRKEGADIFNGALKREDFEYYNAYSDISGSKIFVPQDIRFNAASSVWDGQWIQTNLDSSGQTYLSEDVVNLNATFVNSSNY